MAYALFSRGDRDGFLAMFTPDVEIRTSGRMPGMDRVYRGHAGARQWWDDLREGWEWFKIDHKIEAVEHDRYLIEAIVHGRGASSGVDVRQQLWHVVQMEGTRARRHWSFWERSDALRTLQERKTERPG